MTTSTQPYLDKWMYNPRSSCINILNLESWMNKYRKIYRKFWQTNALINKN